MSEKYGLIKAKQVLPTVDLIRVPHEGKPLIVSIFGPNCYKTNLENMQKQYYNSDEFPNITFREPLTQESISAAAYEFGNLAKPRIFDSNLLQTGKIVRTQDGVYTNTSETDDKRLKDLLNGAEKFNGIYLINDRIAFAPYESFKQGVQEGKEFAEGGLARALEHTSEKTTKNLEKISSKEFYPLGVDVWGFDVETTPVSWVVGLDSGRGRGNDRLDVDGDDWGGDDGGYVFGVQASDEVE